VALRLTGALDTDAMRRALVAVVRRHESLRTVYPADAEGPRQVVIDADPAVPDLPVEEVADGAPLRAAVAEIAGRGFDLTTDPPLRARLLRLNQGTATAGAEAPLDTTAGNGAAPEHVIVLVVHHIS